MGSSYLGGKAQSAAEREAEVSPASVLLTLKEKTLLIHNTAFDLGFLGRIGYEHAGGPVDVMLLSQLLQCYLRAADLEMWAAEEPLRADLDVKGLKAQVLGRIETLEEREREREELLADVLAVADEHGLDAGAMRTVLGG